MTGVRIQVDFWFPNMTLVQVQTKYPELFTALKAAQKDTAMLYPGTPSQENTRKATAHICNHDEDLPCESEQAI